MRYHFQSDGIGISQFGKTYICDHPVYDRCTLYLMHGVGLAVIQQRYNPENKTTSWAEIDRNLVDPIFLHPKFLDLFKSLAKPEDDHKLYPTVTVRQLMWSLRMKPLKRQRWETTFDHKNI